MLLYVVVKYVHLVCLLTLSTLSNFIGLFYSLFWIELKQSVGVKGLMILKPMFLWKLLHVIFCSMLIQITFVHIHRLWCDKMLSMLSCYVCFKILIFVIKCFEIINTFNAESTMDSSIHCFELSSSDCRGETIINHDDWKHYTCISIIKYSFSKSGL